ncbi:hypothetical protein JYU20_00470 [Bacteroidales bacterium AH-315-I05]|nr:hypothetical protein [Bacteroidales bacterium AH-315-I05]
MKNIILLVFILLSNLAIAQTTTFHVEKVIVTAGQSSSESVDKTTVSGMNFKTGTYTGNGETSFGITGAGFAPDFVQIWVQGTADNVALEYWVTTTTIVDDDPGGYAIKTGTDVTGQIDGIKSLDADGFTVGDNSTGDHPNKLNQVYNYILRK